MDTTAIFTIAMLVAALAVISVVCMACWSVDAVMNLVEAERDYLHASAD